MEIYPFESPFETGNISCAHCPAQIELTDSSLCLMNNLRIPVLFAAAFLAFTTFGCKSDSTSTGNSGTSSVPSAGTTFTISSDDGGFLDREIFTVRAADMSHLTSSKVIKAVGVHDNSQVDSTYYAYESNGDVSLFSTSWAQGVWATLPVGTHSDISVSANGGGGVTIQSVAHYEGAGAKYSLNGQQYSTDSVTVTQTSVYQGSQIAVIKEHYSFISSIGLIAIDHIDAASNTTASVSTLTAYSPK